jgi:hypothetical protein
MHWSCLLYQPPNHLLQSIHVLVLPAIPTTQLLTTVYTCAGLVCYTNHPTTYYSLYMCWSCLLYQPPNFLLQSTHVLVLPAIPTTQLLTTVYTCAGLACYTNHPTSYYSLHMCWSCLLYQPLACYTNHPTSYYSLHMCWSCLLYQPQHRPVPTNALDHSQAVQTAHPQM